MSVIRDLGTPAVVKTGPRRPFPTTPQENAASYLSMYGEEVSAAFQLIDGLAMNQAAAILRDAYVRGATVFSCGNGGSAAIANHLQCDHVKGVHAKTGMTPKVVSLSANVELLTAIANDVAFEEVFAYQLQCHARRGDVLIVISSSGRSPNILRALEYAQHHGLHTIALTGFDGGNARTMADVAIHVDLANYGIVEDVHQSVMHALAQFIQQSTMGADEIAASVF
jgi:D-sedoheptulose 7-phosphate isomerase/D-glycero-D-manno-heptose 1,7-bisphosphate phosphatase